MDTKQFEEQVKQFATEWRTRMEEMQSQFSMGKIDATDVFEKQKDKFRDMVVSLKQNLEKATDIAEDQSKNMKTKLEELQLQLGLGKAAGAEAFDEQKKKIESAMKEVYEAGKTAYNKHFDQLLQLFDHNAQSFKTGLEILKLQFSLGKMDATEEAEKARKELHEKMHEMNTQFHHAQQVAKENMEEWSKLMHDGYDRMKSFVDDWMKKK